MSFRNTFVGLAALVLAACGASSGPSSGCTTNDECKNGRVCDVYTGQCEFPSEDVYLPEVVDTVPGEGYVCQNQCVNVGDKICYDQNTLKECQLDQNDCLKWYQTSCEEGQECRNGTCQQNRFVDLGNGTIKDKENGFIWQKGYLERRDYGSALYDCGGVQLSEGVWVLPTFDQLKSLLLNDTYNQSLGNYPKEGCNIDPIFQGPCDQYWAVDESGVCEGTPLLTVDFKNNIDCAKSWCCDEDKPNYVRCLLVKHY